MEHMTAYICRYAHLEVLPLNKLKRLINPSECLTLDVTGSDCCCRGISSELCMQLQKCISNINVENRSLYFGWKCSSLYTLPSFFILKKLNIHIYWSEPFLLKISKLNVASSSSGIWTALFSCASLCCWMGTPQSWYNTAGYSTRWILGMNQG